MNTQESFGQGNHVNKFLQAVFDKYQTFEAELIEECSPKELANLEQIYIDKWFGHEKCMNLRPNVHTMLGFKHSIETKEKIRTQRLGSKSSDATKKKLSKVHSGRLHTKNSKIKLSKALTGKVRTEQQRLEQSASKRVINDEQIQEIKQRFLNGESQGSIARSMNYSQSAISNIINNKRLYQETQS